MKRFGILSLVLLSFLALNSCDDDIFDKGGGNIHYGVSFRKVDLSGASSLVLASGKSEDSKSWTRSSMTKAGDGGDGGGDEQHTDFDYSAPLYKVSADGTMVEVDYQIEIVTKSESGSGVKSEVRDSLNANLRLKMEYIYAIDDKWLLLYNCSYDYPGYDDLPDGTLKSIVNRLITDGNHINRNYMVRLEDGALFLFDFGPLMPGIGRTKPHSQEEVRGAMNVMGKDLYFLDNGPELTRMADRGSTLDLSHVLNSNIRINYILKSGSAFGVVPLYENGQSMMMGMPSVVFPGRNELVPIDGININDRNVQMFLADDELYVSRNNGPKLDEIEYELGDTYLIVDGVEHQMLFQDSLFGYNYAIYNVPAHAGSKIQIKTSIGMLFTACEFTNFDFDAAYEWGMLVEPQGIAEHDYYHEFVIPEDGNYEFYLSLIGPDYGGDIQFAPEGWSATASPGDFNCGRDRYERGEEAAFYKVNITDNSASLSEQPVVRYLGYSPIFSYMESDFETRHRRIINGGVVSWLDEDKDHHTILNRVDLKNKEYFSKELSGRFPSRMNQYYDGVAYVADGNTGYYECSLATAQEKRISFDFTALNRYMSELSTQLSEPQFDSSLMAFTMTAFTRSGTKLTIYVDVTGQDAGKARVYTTESGGAGLVITSMVRLN